mmetsp:Transcript_84280/g.235180  ORF Transcript_84280/g.235180 Transcript_84280/m.235180 type:complete len:317 (-) Transcript_84280:346-1296(-)
MEHDDLLLLERAQQCTSALPDDVHGALDGGCSRREGRGEGGVARANDWKPPSGGTTSHVATVFSLSEKFLQRVIRRFFVDVAELLIKLLALSNEFLREARHDCLHGRGVPHYTCWQAGLFPLGDLFREPVLLLRLQLPLFLSQQTLFLLLELFSLFLQLLLLRVELVLRAAHGCNNGAIRTLGTTHVLALVIRLGVDVPIAGKEGDAHVGLLECPHVVASVAAHQDLRAKLLQGADHVRLPLRRHPCEDPDVSELVPELWFRLNGRSHGDLRHHQVEALGFDQVAQPRGGERSSLATPLACGDGPHRLAIFPHLED